MSSPVVKVINSSNVKCFLKSLRQHGEVLTLDEMYARDEMECNKIALGILKHKFEFVEEGEKKLLKITLQEVYSNGQEGKLFHMFLFGSFAVALKDKKLKNAYVAFRSVNVENNTSHRTQKDDHDLQALLGCPVKNGAKIFLLWKNHKNSAVLPAKRKGIAHVAIDEERPVSSVVEVEPPRDMYKYKKISELVTPENKVNMYGVIAQILRGVEDPGKHAILKIIDETCKENQYFRVHIFFRNDCVNPRFNVGDIVRFHRMKVEEYYNIIDGRIFHASDMVTFPPKGTGKEGAYSTAQSYHFADSDKIQLAVLRKWIQSRRKENKPRDSVLMIGNVSEEGTYTLGCKVLRVDEVADDMLILIVTDCIPGKTGNDQTKKKEMKIVAVDPPDELKTIPVNTDVILNNVEVDVTFVPCEGQEQIIFFYKMMGPLCRFKLLRRLEDEPVTQRRQLRDMDQSEEVNNTADNILKQIYLFSSHSEELKDSLELQNVDDGMKQVLLTPMKETAADNNVERSQRSQDSAHFENSDNSLLGMLETMNLSLDAPKENTQILEDSNKTTPKKVSRNILTLFPDMPNAACISNKQDTHNICLISEQQKLSHSMENVHTRNEELLPTSDCLEKNSEADTGRKLHSAVRELSDNEIELATKGSSDVTYSQFVASVSKNNSEFCTSTQPSINVSSDPVSQAEESRDSPTSEDGSRFASDITDLPGMIAASISHVKQHDVHQETIFVLKAWLTKIEPSIDLTKKFPVSDIIYGSCHSCLKYYSYRAIRYKEQRKAVCKNCHKQGKKVLLNLSFLLHLHLLDENDDSLVVTLCGPNAVEFLGCTVRYYLGDEFIFNRVNKALSNLILRDKHLPPTNRGLMLKLIVSPIMSLKGVEYIMHNTFLYVQKCLR